MVNRSIISWGLIHDPDLVDLIAPVADSFETVRAFVVLGDSADGVGLPNAVAYEDLLVRG